MNIPLFDAHCDTIYKVSTKGGGLRKNSYHLDLERGCRFSPYAQVFAVFTRPEPEKGTLPDYSKDLPPERLLGMGTGLLNLLLSELKKNADIITLCTSTRQAQEAARAGKAAAFIAVEGAELIGCSLPLLKSAYELGVRLINLCWNYDNALCGAANGAAKGGLTPLGREYVAQMQALGMVVDMSHVSERGFWDTAEIAVKPIIAGHSNSKKICDNPRNLTDAQFCELVRLKGVAGLNLCPEFLNESGRAEIDDVIRHAEHFLELGGEKAICLGGDLDGVDSLPKGFYGVECYGEIYEAMLRQNWKESLIRDIFYNNLFNVLERTL